MKIKDTSIEELTQEYIRAFRAGYVAGFGNTGEGYNAECPFYDNFENEESFERSYKEALEQYIEDDE
jgi:hypothetical protein